eukprot:171344_1
MCIYLLLLILLFITNLQAQNYVMVREQLSFSDAESHCINTYGTHLASIHSEPDNAEAYNLCAANKPSTDWNIFSGCWIGYSDVNATGAYNWEDSSTTNFINWRDGAPNDVDMGWSSAVCAFIKVNLDDSQWEDTGCSINSAITRFLCNKAHSTSYPTKYPTKY